LRLAPACRPGSGRIRRSERYDDSFITERKPFRWPGDNTIAVWFAPNVEVWHYDSAFGVGITPNPTNHVPDVFNYAWREYGMRVGLCEGFRMPAARNGWTQVGGRRPKASKGGNRDGRTVRVSLALWGFDGGA
jgi:hypothetical protein